MAGFAGDLVSDQGKALKLPVMWWYMAFLACIAYVFHVVAGSGSSALLTVSNMAQCFAFLLLVLQVHASGSLSGISIAGLKLDALAICFRLSSTTWLAGYLPFDATGDHIYQLTDVLSLMVILYLFHQAIVMRWAAYDAHEDAFPVGSVVLISLTCGILFHADLDNYPLFDSLWMAGLLMSVVAAVPQLSLIARTGSSQALTSHFIAVLGLSRMLSGYYMWSVGEDITCEEWITGFNHALVVILGTHVVHLLLLADFMYFYVTTMVCDGPSGVLKLEGASYV